MKKLLFLLFSILSLYTHSQDIKIKGLISPLCIFDDYSFPTIQHGFELRLTKRLALYSEAGIKFMKTSYEYTDTSFVKSKGYKLKTEIRYYVKNWNNQKGTNERGLFLGINTFCIRHSFNDLLYYTKDSDPDISIPDSFSVLKHVWGANLVFGWQQVFIKHIVIESYGGFGLRRRKTENHNLQFNPSMDEIVPSIDPNYEVIMYSINSEAGIRSLFNFTAGFRMGYQF